jgi:hypothetical protein
MPSRTRRAQLGRLGVGFAIAAAAVLVSAALTRTDFAARVELTTYDWRMRQS